MTHMHHPTRWADGGETNRDGIMICPGHHSRAHDHRYEMTKLPTGKYTLQPADVSEQGPRYGD